MTASLGGRYDPWPVKRSTDWLTDCAKRSHAGIVFTHWPKNGFFAPQGRHVAPINVKVGTGEGPLPRANFHVYQGKNVGIQPPKLSKFRILARNLYLRFALFLRNSQRLYASIGIAFKFLVWSLSRDKHPSYKHFPAVGALSHKFSVAPSGETTTRIKKSCKNGTDLLYHHAKYGGDRGSRAGCRRKSVMFLSFFFVFCHALELRSLW